MKFFFVVIFFYYYYYIFLKINIFYISFVIIFLKKMFIFIFNKGFKLLIILEQKERNCKQVIFFRAEKSIQILRLTAGLISQLHKKKNFNISSLLNDDFMSALNQSVGLIDFKEMAKIKLKKVDGVDRSPGGTPMRNKPKSSIFSFPSNSSLLISPNNQPESEKVSAEDLVPQVDPNTATSAIICMELPAVATSSSSAVTLGMDLEPQQQQQYEQRRLSQGLMLMQSLRASRKGQCTNHNSFYQ